MADRAATAAGTEPTKTLGAREGDQFSRLTAGGLAAHRAPPPASGGCAARGLAASGGATARDRRTARAGATGVDHTTRTGEPTAARSTRADRAARGRRAAGRWLLRLFRAAGGEQPRPTDDPEDACAIAGHCILLARSLGRDTVQTRLESTMAPGGAVTRPIGM